MENAGVGEVVAEGLRSGELLAQEKTGELQPTSSTRK